MSDESKLAVTIDLEFFDCPFLFRGRNKKSPEEVEGLGLEGVEFVLDVFEENNVLGTFFVLGKLAEEYPELIKKIADKGHEIGSHGYSKSHPDLREMSNKEVEDEIKPTKPLLEEISGSSVTGYRAPAFAVNEDVLEVVLDSGFEYDSSIVPSREIPGFYGFPEFPKVPFSSEKMFSFSGLRELPLSVNPYFRLPVSGAWMRLLGRKYCLWSLKKCLEKNNYGVVYIHPWELVELPRYDEIPNRIYWRTGAYTRKTFERIVSNFSDNIVPMNEI